MLEIWVVHVTYDLSLNWLHIMYTFDLETTIVNWHRYAPFAVWNKINHIVYVDLCWTNIYFLKMKKHT